MKFLLFLLIINCGFLYGQDSTMIDSILINSNNTISGMYMYNNNSPLYTLSYFGDNGIERKSLKLSTNTSYSYQYGLEPISNEWQQKSNLNYKNFFILHVFNYSLVRNISNDNSIGIGIAKWWKYGSISYAAIYQKIDYEKKSNTELFRHSLRLKLKYENSFIGISYEYYFQPNVILFKDNIIYGNIKLSLFNKKKINLSISDIVNYRSISNVKMIHTLYLGIGFNFKN
jgi:hypothetical protein